MKAFVLLAVAAIAVEIPRGDVEAFLTKEMPSMCWRVDRLSWHVATVWSYDGHASALSKISNIQHAGIVLRENPTDCPTFAAIADAKGMTDLYVFECISTRVDKKQSYCPNGGASYDYVHAYESFLVPRGESYYTSAGFTGVRWMNPAPNTTFEAQMLRGWIQACDVFGRCIAKP